jgi:hypothetical protein
VTSATVAAVERRYSRGALWAAIVVMIAWHVGSTLPTVLTVPSSSSLTSRIVWVGYAVIGAWSTIVQLRDGGRGPALPLIAAPLMLAGVVAVALTNPTGSILDRFNWAFSDVVWIALVVFWRRPVAELAAFCAADVAIGFGVLIAAGETDRINLARYTMAAYSVVVLQLTILVGGRALTALARRTAEAQDAQAAVATRALAADSLHRSRRLRRHTVQQVTARLLAGLADGTLDPARSEHQPELRVAVTRLRRLIVETDEVPDPLLHELRACADAAERRGVAVDLQAPVGTLPALPRDVRRAMADPVISVLAAAHSHARVTVVASGSDLVVAVVADVSGPVPPPTVSADVEVTYESEEGLLWAQTHWRDQSRSPSLKTSML